MNAAVISLTNGATILSRADNASNASESMFVWKICLNHPDLPACADVPSYYSYRLSLAANATFLALFSLSLIGFVVVYGATRRGLVFAVAMILGVLCEIIGYAGRVLSYKNQWAETGFLIQICCLTIGPAFMSAGIYLCLRRIVYAFGPENSRIPPKWYTRLFIPCDLVSLILQATGGGMAAVASHNQSSPDQGDNIMIAGLAFQVFTLLIFMGVSADFGLNAARRHRQLGDAAFDQTAAVVAVRQSRLFKAFVGALALSTVCIFWRSAYRVAELSGGWEGPLMARQDLFIGFEGVMVIIASLVLNVFYPGYCIGPLMERTKKTAQAARGEEMQQKGEPASSGSSI